MKPVGSKRKRCGLARNPTTAGLAIEIQERPIAKQRLTPRPAATCSNARVDAASRFDANRLGSPRLQRDGATPEDARASARPLELDVLLEVGDARSECAADVISIAEFGRNDEVEGYRRGHRAARSEEVPRALDHDRSLIE